MNDDDVRAILDAAIAKHSGRGGNGTVLLLARIGQELMRQRDARSEDFYTAKTDTRAQVAEEIARAIEAAATAVAESTPPKPARDSVLETARRCAQIAREHGTGE